MFINEKQYSNLPHDCFGSILSDALRDAEIVSYSEFRRVLESKGITNIGERRISEYCNGTFTPPFEKARVIFDVLDYEIDDDEVKRSLEANRRYSKSKIKSYRRKDDKEIKISIRLKLSRILPEINPTRTEMVLKNRIEELCGDKNKYTEYIHALIAKDLTEYILTEESIQAVKEERTKSNE